jgi:hypothetical protein
MNKLLLVPFIFLLGAEVTVVPDSEIINDWTGAYTDIDEDIATPNLTDFITTDSVDNTAAFNLSNPGLVDGDTITNVTVKIHAKDNDSSNRIDVKIYIGGVSQGTVNVNTTTTAATYTTNNVGWNTDWTASQLDGMALYLVSDSNGAEGDYWIYTANVIITYTAAVGGATNVVRMIL